ncbi:MAG: hypothetical protein AAFP08_00855 [Bacteroidota bacterium]
MPVIHFGMGFTERKLPLDDHPILHEQSVDKAGLVSFLEGFYGYLPPAERQDYLRVEQFRQLLRDDLAEHPNAFYRASFEADPLATAEHVLSLRDELIEAGYKLMHPVSANCPDRLKTLHRLEEALLANEPSKKWPLGMADRVYRLIGVLEWGKHPALWVRLHEPLALLDPGSQRLLKALSDCDDFVQYLPSPNFPEEDTDLARWQRSGWTVRESDPSDFVSPADTEPKESFIRRWASEGQRQIASWKKESLAPTNAQSIDPQKNQLQNDGSLILIKAARDTHISAYLAKLKRLNPDWKPAVLMAKKRQTLDLSFRMEGLPNIGVPSTSLARPSLQVLKLVPTFLWEPVDLRKLHEFLKLIVKPLDRRLGYRLAAALSDSPGLFSEAWFQATTQFFDQELPRLAKRDSRIEPETIESQYNFWFRRTRYPIEGRAPKSEVRKLFVFLVNWVKSRLDEDSDDAIGLNTLAAQAKRAVDLIDQVDEDEFSPLQVDRIVRTVYEAAPANFHAEQQHSLPAAFHTAAICGEISELIWWDFVQEEADYFFSNWFQNELNYLTSQSVHLLIPSAKNQRQIWSRTRPLLFTKDRLVLCIPDRISGTEVSAHPLLGELEALFGDQLDSISMHIDKDGDPSFLDWPSPEFSITDLNPLDPPVPFITIGSSEHMHERPYESPSSLERFLYHPHQWAFQYGLLIKPSRQPELRLGTRLRGLLSHRFMERIFEDNRPLKEWTQAAVNRWVVQQEPDILRREGGLFLEYGYEPDRVQFAGRCNGRPGR